MFIMKLRSGIFGLDDAEVILLELTHTTSKACKPIVLLICPASSGGLQVSSISHAPRSVAKRITGSSGISRFISRMRSISKKMGEPCFIRGWGVPTPSSYEYLFFAIGSSPFVIALVISEVAYDTHTAKYTSLTVEDSLSILRT